MDIPFCFLLSILGFNPSGLRIEKQAAWVCAVGGAFLLFNHPLRNEQIAYYF
jgi:hypothetical protein